MEAPAKGAVVLVRFPVSDLSQTKLRPALGLADDRVREVGRSAAKMPWEPVPAVRTADSGGENQSGNKYVSVSSDSYQAVRRLSTWTDSSSYVKVPFMRPSASGRLVHVMSRNRYVPPVGNVIVASPVKVNTDSVNVPRTGTRKR